MSEMSQRHPVWVAENHVKPCNSVLTINVLARDNCFGQGYREITPLFSVANSL